MLEKPPINSIVRIVEYLWHEEKVHFEATDIFDEYSLNLPIEIYPHIFNDLKIVQRWLSESNA